MIRRTGMYVSDEMVDEFVNHPDTFDTLVDNYIRVRNELREAQPKLETYNRIMNSDAAFPMGVAAKIMNFQAPQRKRKSIGRNHWVTPRGIEFIMNLLKEHGYELRQNEPIPEKYNNLNIYEVV